MLPLALLSLLGVTADLGSDLRGIAGQGRASAAHLPREGRQSPAAREQVLPKYPPGGEAIRGFVDVEVVVDVEGGVSHARISKPLDGRVDQEALAAVRNWRFRPGSDSGGRPLPMLMVVRLQYEPSAAGAAGAVSAHLRNPPRFTSSRSDLFASAPRLDLKSPGVSNPKLVRNIVPNYTSDAMRRKIQGAVELEAVVMPDGTVGGLRVVKSLDDRYGLDEEAIQAAGRWFFEPGRVNGSPSAIIVTMVLEFRLR